MILPYLVHIAIIMAIFLILSLGLNLAVGYTGMLNMGHIAFFGIGAYTSALLTGAGVPWILAFLASGVVASLGGFLLVLATRKLKGDYLALTTLGFSFVVTSVMLNWTSLTRGPLGIAGIAKPSLFGFKISSNNEFLLLVIIISALSYFCFWLVTKSPFGRLMQAVRDNELAAKTLGKNTFGVKYKAMMISAFFAGLAGSLYAHYITFIDPGSFAMTDMILLFTIIIVGGLASLRGTLLATIIMLAIPELIRFLPLSSSILGPMRQIIYAVILIGILLIRPKGLFGRVDLK